MSAEMVAQDTAMARGHLMRKGHVLVAEYVPTEHPGIFTILRHCC